MNKTTRQIRYDREQAEQKISDAKKDLDYAKLQRDRNINKCAKLGHPNAIHDNIEKMSECPDCGHYWGSGRAHY